MNRIVVRSKVSLDGIVHLSVPVGLEEADKEVQVTVEPFGASRPMTQAEWQAMAGTWQGEFERPPQGE